MCFSDRNNNRKTVCNVVVSLVIEFYVGPRRRSVLDGGKDFRGVCRGPKGNDKEYCSCKLKMVTVVVKR